MNLLLLLSLTHMSFPRARAHTRKFFELSYYNPSSGRYAKGWDDAAYVSCWVVVFAGLRVAVMEYIFSPLAEAGGIVKKKEKIRFAEQAWVFVYNSASWSMGVVWPRRLAKCHDGCVLTVASTYTVVRITGSIWPSCGPIGRTER